MCSDAARSLINGNHCVLTANGLVLLPKEPFIVQMKFSRRVGGRGYLSHLRRLWWGGGDMIEFPTKMKIQGGKGSIVDDYVFGGAGRVQKSVCTKTVPPPKKK